MRSPPMIWLATFDSAEARLVRYDPTPERPAARVVELDRLSGPHRPRYEDRAGRVQESASPRRAAMAAPSEAEDVEERRFVHALIERLAADADAGRFDRLVIAAAPHALGAFRAAVPPGLRAHIVAELDRDHVHTPLLELAAILDALR